MSPKNKHTRRPKQAEPFDQAKYEAQNTNACLNFIFKKATRKYGWMIEAPVVHPSVLALDGWDTVGAQCDGRHPHGPLLDSTLIKA
jgi:hypothetical protein